MKQPNADHTATAANQAVGACGRRSADKYESIGLASQTLVGTQRAGVRINPMAIYGEEGHSTLRQGASVTLHNLKHILPAVTDTNSGCNPDFCLMGAAARALC